MGLFTGRTDHPEISSSAGFRWVRSVFVTLLVLILTQLLRIRFQIPNPGAIVLLAVVYAAYTGGIMGGLVSAAMCACYCIYYMTASHPFRLDGVARARLAVFLPIMPAMALLVGVLRRRTERMSQRLLRYEQGFSGSVMTSMRDGLIVFAEQTVRDVNPALCAMTGFSREELIGAKFPYPFCPSEDHAAHESAYNRFLDGDQAEFDLIFCRKNGERFPAIVSVSRLSNERQPGAKGAVASVKDVSERERAEVERVRAALEARRLMAEAQLQTRLSGMILDEARSGILVMDGRNFWIKRVNATCRQFLEQPHRSADLTGTSLLKVVPGLGENVVELFRQVAATGRGVSMREVEFRGFSRGTTYWNFSCTPLPARDPAEPDLLIQADEVTEQVMARRRVEELAAHAEANLAELEAVVNSMSDGLIVADGAGNIVASNPAALRMHGFASLEEMQGSRGVLEFCYADGLCVPGPDHPLARVLRGETYANLALQVHRPESGRRFVGNYSGTVVRNRAGQIVQAVLTVQDVTQRTLAEQAAEASAARAEAYAAAAEAANQAKDQFLAVLSHELRTPLTPVLMAVEMLQGEQGHPPETEATLEMIRRNVELEARLIDDLLDLTRIARAKIDLNLTNVDTHAKFTSAIEICRPELDEKRLKVQTDLSATRRFVRADPARLQQVFWNLVKNAVKFTPAGGTITFRSWDVADSSALALSVSDTGIGIEPHVLPKIFDAFEQGSPAVTRRFGGLGLGLAISKTLVDLHGGRLTASSEGKDCGATFTVELPAVAEPPAAVAPASPGHRSPARSSLRILMVDDHDDTNRAMKRLLESVGYEVKTAGSVNSAMAAAAQDKFDLLISDIGLPDGTGHELMRHIRQRYQMRGIALSGFGMEDDVRKSAEAGFAMHLTKPINFDKLDSAIREVASPTELVAPLSSISPV